MSSLIFRNVDVSPDDPPETWPIEAVQSALERGHLSDWRRLTAAIRRDPWGPLARRVEYVLTYARPYGTAPLFERAIARARDDADAADRRLVAARLREALHASGLTQTEFAARLGTSQPRLSTYVAGTVTPSAAILVRAERLAQTRTTARPAPAPAPAPAPGDLDGAKRLEVLEAAG